MKRVFKLFTYLTIVAALFSNFNSIQAHAAFQTSGLVANWLGSTLSGSSTTWTDSSGNGNTLSLNSNTYSASSGGYESFDGSSSYMHDGSNLTPTFTGNTMSQFYWIYPKSNGAVISGMARSTTITNENVFSINSSGYLSFWDYNNGTYGFNAAVSSATVPLNQWSYVGFTKGTANTATLTFYINGVAAGSTTGSSNINAGLNDFTLGKDYRDNVSYFNGYFGQASIWSTTLSSTDVTNNYNATLNNYYPAPSITSSPQTQNVQFGTAITPVVTTNTGGATTSYSISPTLPSGLIFNTSTGGITGTATVVSPATNYTITGTSSYGSSSFTISIAVLNWIANFSPPTNPSFNQTVSMSLTVAGSGTVTFYANGKKIFRCVGVAPVSNIATCSWKPVVRGNYFIYAVFTGNGQTITSNQVKVNVVPRTSARQP